MNPNYRSFFLWGAIVLVVIAMFSFFQGGSLQGSTNKLSYTDFVTKVENGDVRNVNMSVTARGENITGTTVNGERFTTFAPRGSDVMTKMQDKGVDIKAEEESSGTNPLLGLLISSLPILLLIGVTVFFMRQMQGGKGGGAMGFGKSKAKLLEETKGRVTFNDVAGVDEAKTDLEEVVEFLRDPQKFQRLGGKIPRGVLLVGPPGTGKTLLARSVAGEANVPFFTISGSDFVEMFVGVGASRVRDMFEQAKKSAPCIIFIDEIDAVGRQRGAGLGGGNDEREQTLNQLLVEMDGFDVNENIILIAATNRPDVLDPALLRPGRFDRQVVVPNPEITGREKILGVHTRNVPLAPNVDLKVVARGTPGFSGADLMNLVNEAALLAARRNKRLVTMQEFEDAKDKILMGAERRSMAMTQAEKELTAYHEAGHAVVAMNVLSSDPVHKATIVPRGRALGMVMQLPEGDSYSRSYTYMVSRLAIMMGGRVAEETKFGKENITAGPASDIEQATKLARSMVTRWGFSDKLGKVAYGESQDEPFVGNSAGHKQIMSEETARLIDAEVRKLIDDAHEEARRILTEKADDWKKIAEGLLEFETLSGEELKDIIAGKPIVREETGSASVRKSSIPKVKGKDAENKDDQTKSEENETSAPTGKNDGHSSDDKSSNETADKKENK